MYPNVNIRNLNIVHYLHLYSSLMSLVVVSTSPSEHRIRISLTNQIMDPDRSRAWWRPQLSFQPLLVAGMVITAIICFILGIIMIILSRKQGYFTKSIEICNTTACVDTAYQFLHRIDDSISPCDDFYKFACGRYIEREVIPDNKIEVSAFEYVNTRVNNELRKSFEEPLNTNDSHSIRLVKNFYMSCMDTKRIERLGLEPLLDILRTLGGWPILDGTLWEENSFDWIEFAFKCRDMGLITDYFINFGIGVDTKNTTKRILELDQPRLGLSREYILSNDTKALNAYRKYIIEAATVFGVPRDSIIDEVNKTIEFIRELANVSLSQEDRRNATKLYHPVTVRKLARKYPSIPWKKYFNKMITQGTIVDNDDIVNVIVPNYISNFIKIMNKTPNRVQANYALWRVVAASIPFQNEALRYKELEFMAEITGKINHEERWEECTQAATQFLPLSVSSVYIKKYFNKDAKAKTTEMVDDIRNEFNEMLKKVNWMDEQTKNNAIEKANLITTHIAYPDELLDDKKIEEFHHNLTLSSDNYFKNILNFTSFKTNIVFGQLRETVNKTDWRDHGMSVMVNAYYSTDQNSIILPAAILQGHFFNSNRPKYLNYGAIGFIIGHELIHGFDDEGRQLDKNGNLIDWWAPSTAEKYLRKAQCIIKQYGNYSLPDPDKSSNGTGNGTESKDIIKINGVHTQGENIADNGGIKLAYSAYKSWVARNGEEPSLPGVAYSPQQLFWISASNLWCSKMRPRALKSLAATDPHSPDEFRVLGTFSNMKEFAEDFKCQEGSPMNPKDKCEVW